MKFDKPKTIVTRYNGFTPIAELDCANATFPKCLTDWGVSRHITEHRQSRFQAMEVNAGFGTCAATFVVQRNGRREIHCIFDNGVITTQVEGSSTVQTFMFARPEQIKEYWIGQGKTFPFELDYLLKIADGNQYLAWHD